MRTVAGIAFLAWSVLQVFGVGWPQYMAALQAILTTASEQMALSRKIQAIGVAIGERSPEFADFAYGVVCFGVGVGVAATVTAIAALHALVLDALIVTFDEYEGRHDF